MVPATTGCKGCATHQGPSGCPVHHSGPSELVCQTCGYRGPESAHGACSSDPMAFCKILRGRIQAVETRLARLENDGAPAPLAREGMPEREEMIAKLGGAWRRLKGAMLSDDHAGALDEVRIWLDRLFPN